MEIPAVQNLIDATLNPVRSLGNDATSITAQSTEPVATGGESATSDSGFGSSGSSDAQSNLGSNLNEKA